MTTKAGVYRNDGGRVDGEGRGEGKNNVYSHVRACDTCVTGTELISIILY
jgi:hypothetical protein